MTPLKYHKIHAPYMRHREGPDRGKFITGAFSRPEFADLWHTPWNMREKVDGTNIRLSLDSFGQIDIMGRTDKAQLLPELTSAIRGSLDVEMLSEMFIGYDDEAVPFTLYGEGLGGKIQGGLYGPEYRFILFDVRVGKFWLTPDDVDHLGSEIGLEVAHNCGTMTPVEAEEIVRDGGYLTEVSGAPKDRRFEGLIGTPRWGLKDRSGARIITKFKVKDYQQ